MLPTSPDLSLAVAALKAGEVIAYPTEAVWGLGCDPFNAAAVDRLLELKQRPASKGLILIAASLAQVEPWLAGLDAAQRAAVEASWPGPVTWVVPVDASMPAWIRGDHDSVAVRVSAHAGVQALCRAWGGVLVSTSANLSGQPAITRRDDILAQFGSALGHVLHGELGGDTKPSEIRDALSGTVLRPR